MASRDYLIRQIEEMGLFLSILLRRILKMKEENQLEQVESVVREELFQELKLDIDQIIMLDNEDFLHELKTILTTEDQLEKLAEILQVMGLENQPIFSLTKVNYLQKSLFLFIHLQQSSFVFSYERRVRIMELLEALRLRGFTNLDYPI